MAMGARGATASSEAADVVLTVDRLESWRGSPDRAPVVAHCPPEDESYLSLGDASDVVEVTT